MNIYQTKSKPIPGTTYKEVYKKAIVHYKKICRGTKRKPYIRSIYFSKEKIFIRLFWIHLHEKMNYRDKTRRLKFFTCGIDLIKQSTIHPISKESISKSEILHRFAGKTKDGIVFFVQIKENKRNKQKHLISIFPK